MQIIKRSISRLKALKRRIYRTSNPVQLRDWSRTNFYAAVGLLLLAMILLAVASPGPLSVDLPDHMASTNAAFIELVLVAAGGFFVSGFIFFLVAWQVSRKGLTRGNEGGFRLNSNADVFSANTSSGKSDVKGLLAKLRSKVEV
jgi:hypothetical protein